MIFMEVVDEEVIPTLTLLSIYWNSFLSVYLLSNNFENLVCGETGHCSSVEDVTLSLFS